MKKNVKERNWYTPEEVCEIVFNGMITTATIRNMCKRGEIPCQRFGIAKDNVKGILRRRFYIPASYVNEMLEKAKEF